MAAADSKTTKECSVETMNDPLKLPEQSSIQVCRIKGEGKTRRSFSFEEKLNIINLLDTHSKAEVCKKFTLDESTLNKWIKQSAKIKEICTNKHTKKLKKQKTTAIKDLDDMLYAWFLTQQARGAPITGPILKDQALVIKSSLGIENFKASNHWLDGWKKRKNVRLLRTQEEKSSADEAVSFSFTSNFEVVFVKNELT